MITKQINYAAAKRRTHFFDMVFYTINFIVLAFLVIVTVYPFWNTIAVSFNDGLDALKGGITLWPRIFTWQNYKALFTTGQIFDAFKISVSRTILQAILSVFCTCMLAYALSRKEFVLKKPFTFVLVVSMYISAGLIPNYMLIKRLGLLKQIAGEDWGKLPDRDEQRKFNLEQDEFLV